MKRSAFVFIGVLLFALMGCGGGGGGGTSGIPGGGGGGEIGGGGDVATGPVGFITISMSSPDGPEPNVPVTTDNLLNYSSLRNGFRVVVKQVADIEFIDEEGNPLIVRTELRRVVQDNTIPGSVRIAVPPGDGYTVELLTYQLSGSIRNMLQYGQSTTFSIASGASTTVSLTLNPVSQYITMTAPDNVVTEFSYSVSVGKTVPLRSQYYLSQTNNTASWPIPNFVVGYDPLVTPRTATSVTFTAPTVTAQSNVYLQGQFFIDDSLLNTSELAAGASAWSNWRINCPDPAYTQSVRSILLLPGTIVITPL